MRGYWLIVALCGVAHAEDVQDAEAAAKEMAQLVCGSPHLDAALTALRTHVERLADLAPDSPVLVMAERAARQCIRDMNRIPIPADAVLGAPLPPSVADALCACPTSKCLVQAARQLGEDPPTAEARQRAVLCLRGGYRAALAAQEMERAVCACTDLQCAQHAASTEAEKLLKFKHMQGSNADIADIKAAGDATARCMKRIARAAISKPVNQAATPSGSPR